MIHYEVQSRIPRPPAEIFDYVVVNQVKNHPKWEDEVLEVRREGPPSIGQKGIMVRKDGRRTSEVPFETIELVPNRRWVVHSGSGGFQLKLVFDMQPAGDETDFTVAVTAKLSGLFWILTPIFKRQFPKTSARIMRQLTALLNEAQ